MASGLAINGTLERGQDVRTQNTMACSALANIVKSSLGPVGLDKMLVDEMGEVTITNDGATILKRLEVEHPAAKVLVELSNLQDQEVGDGTTSVVILAAELVKQGNKLVKEGVHPTQVISAYNLAKKEACKFIAEKMATKVDTLGKDSFINAAKTSLSSKIITAEAEFFSKLAVDAIAAVKTTSRSGKTKYPVKAITILKAHGKSIKESELVNGYALNNERRSDSMPAVCRGAKIALLDFELRKAKMGLGVQVVVSDPKKLDAIRQREGDITKERIRMILNAGANVILTTKSMDDLAIAEFVEAKAMAFARVSKTDIRNIAKATGGTVVVSLADMEGAESVDSKMFGECDMVEEVKVGDGKLTYFKGCKNTKAQTIILRGANDYMLDEVDRSLHDSLCVVKRVLESNSVVPGGGCVESALAIFMEFLAGTMGSREQLGLMAFAEAMLVIPKQLAINGAFDATDLIAKLRSYHHSAQHKPGQATKDYMWAGLDLDKGQVRNNLTAGVLEPAISKIKMIRFATEAAVTILRIDDSIKMAPKDNPKGPVEDDY